MKTWILPAIVLAFALASLTACTPPSHSRDARDLRDQLEGLDGVRAVALEYDEPGAFYAAEVVYEVVMADGADADEVAAVVETAYSGLANAHHDEEGNLRVTFGRDRLDHITLRTFESEADVADVAEAALVSADIVDDYDEVFVHLQTQEVAEAPYVEAAIQVRLPRRTPATEVEAERVVIEEQYSDRDLPVETEVWAGHR